MASYYGDRSQNVPSWDTFEAGDDEDVVDTSEYAYAARDHVLFCIDASRSMQTPRPDIENEEGIIRGKSALQQVLEAVVDLQRKKVITGPADSVGVMLWNVDPSKPSSSNTGNYKPGTMVYQPLRTINAEEMKKVIKLVEQAQDEYSDQEDEGKTKEPSILAETFPPAKEGEELNIADVLVTCNFLFRDAGTKLPGNKRVFMITDNDEPPGSASNREPARTVYGDLLTYGITINTFFVDRADHRFNPTIYWNDILGRGDDEDAPDDAEPESEGLDKLADLLTDLAIRNAPKRVQFSIPLKMGGRNGEIEIGVAGYALVSEQGKGQPKYVRMRGQAVEEVLTKTEYTSAETGAVLRDDEIGQAFQFGHEATIQNVLERNWWESSEDQEAQRQAAEEVIRIQQERKEREENGEAVEVKEEETEPKAPEDKKRIVARTRLRFTSEEIAEFKSMGMAPQIRILGFQSPSDISLEDNIKHSYFLYPDEDTYTGSTRTFAALLKSCIKLDKHALAICRFKTNITPEFAVLIPQEETLTEGGGQDMPPGFHVIVLPFIDDIRAPPKNMTDNITASEMQAKLMSNIVKRLRSKAGRYRSEVYPNPALQYHYAQLQALAFEEDFDLSQKIDEIDKTFPKYWGMHKAAGDFMAQWNREIEDDPRAVAPVKAASKRSAAAKTFELEEDELADVRGYYNKGELSKLSVQKIKDYAKFNGVKIPTGIKKAELVELMSDWFVEHPSGAKKTKKG